MKHLKNNYLSRLLIALFFFIIPFTSVAAEMDHSQHKMKMDNSKHKMEMDQPKHDMDSMSNMEKMHKGEDVQMDIAMGKMIYQMTCIFCHGSQGRGDGPAASYIGPYSSPRPRDFYRGVFKFRSTKSGNLPTGFDLIRTVRDGIPGYMPSFRYLGREKLRQVVLYITQFYKRKTDRKMKKKGIPYEEISIDHSVSFTKESIAKGEKVYVKLECNRCHGMEGKGDGPSAKELKDDKGLPIIPADLTKPSSFKNGNNHEDIYRTIITGLGGTPMPSFAYYFKGEGVKKAWDLVHYVLSLSPDEEWTRMGRAK